MSKKLTQEEFINIIIANHGDIYSFEKTIFNETNQYITITCKKHKCDIVVIAETLLRRTQRNGGKKKDPIVGSCPVCREEYFADIKKKMFNKFREIHNNEYDYIEDSYVNTDTPFKIICKIHGEFSVLGQVHSSGMGKCPQCYPLSKYKKFEKFVDNKRYYICEIHGDVPIGLTRHLTQGCPECNKIKGKFKIENNIKNNVKKNIIKRFEKNYNIIFNNNNTITLICKKHGTSEIILKKNINYKKYYCNNCRQEAIDDNMKKLNDIHNIKVEKIKNILLNEYKNQYEFLEVIKSNKSDHYKVKLYNVLLEKERIVSAHTILCGELSKRDNNVQRNLVDYDEAKRRVNELGIKSLREYKKWHIRTKQTEMPSNPHRAYKDRWINHFEFFNTNKKDLMSAGEKRIYNYLQRKNIEFIWQKRFKDCKDKNTLPFDFYLPKYNLIVEFDGEQHYKITFRFGKEGLEKTQKHDLIKNKYCADNNINIIRLTHDDLSNNMIEWMLDDELSKIGAEMAIQNI
jgi:very-short-patch-repair endonuclease